MLVEVEGTTERADRLSAAASAAGASGTDVRGWCSGWVWGSWGTGWSSGSDITPDRPLIHTGDLLVPLRAPRSSQTQWNQSEHRLCATLQRLNVNLIIGDTRPLQAIHEDDCLSSSARRCPERPAWAGVLDQMNIKETE